MKSTFLNIFIFFVIACIPLTNGNCVAAIKVSKIIINIERGGLIIRLERQIFLFLKQLLLLLLLWMKLGERGHKLLMIKLLAWELVILKHILLLYWSIKL